MSILKDNQLLGYQLNRKLENLELNDTEITNNIITTDLQDDLYDEDNPCLIHALLDPSNKMSKFRKLSMKQSQDASELARTAVAVRLVSKKLAKKRIKFNNPKSILVVTKPGDKKLIKLARDLVEYLLLDIKLGSTKGMTVYVDKHLEKSKRFRFNSLTQKIVNPSVKLNCWTPELVASSPELFDLVITLGGDGTVLYTSWLFQKIVPSVMPFHLGSLGFLTTFDFNQHRNMIQQSLEEGVRINMRMRFSCTIFKYDTLSSAPLSRVCSSNGNYKKAKNLKSHASLLFGDATIDTEEEEIAITSPFRSEFGYKGFIEGMTYEILNDLVVDRGPSPFMSQLELFGDGEYLTTVQADGLTVATPTGSTAYSLAAGGSLVHPEIPALLISPICPHSLSFRPMLLPDSITLCICVPFSSRGTAWASFDGRGRVELSRGDFIRVVASKFPFPTVCAEGTQSKDWFNSLNRCLLWNQRSVQKPLDESSQGEEDSSEDIEED
ncbi:ATP-NAD kinase [Neoconidiobolus thromboides FSU 785]|nr:ATP-NAD kinase [Neoconidiobolus thromboides FSU 785]